MISFASRRRTIAKLERARCQMDGRKTQTGLTIIAFDKASMVQEDGSCMAFVEDHGWCPYSGKLGAVLVDGEWHNF